MNSACLFAISCLLILLITTSAAFLLVIRKMKDREKRGISVERSDILLGLFTQKAREARAAAERLSRVADELGIGLVERTPDKGTIANMWAKKFCCGKSSCKAVFDEFIAKSNFPYIVKQGERVIKIRRLEAGDRQVLLLQDVTEGFRLARKLKQKERLALLGQMSAQVAHQIKTPLSVLAGRAQMLARRLPPGSAERKQAEAFFLESRALAGQVTRIVNFYKEMEPEFSRVTAKEVLKKTFRRLEPIAGGCRVSIDTPDDVEMVTDVRLLSDALFLVAQNSLGPDVGAALLEITACRKQGGVRITIRDNGKGFGEGSPDRIFEPFYTTREEGLGLGLFMARDILSRIGGRIRASRPPDGGALFEMEIPLMPQSAQAL